MVRVAIVSPSFSSADAVTNDALGMFDVLARHGHEVRLFCESHSLRQPRIGELTDVSGFLKNPGDIFLLHHSRGWSDGVELLQRLNCRRAIKYHNVTPARFFAGFSSYDEEQCELGRKQLTDLARANCELYLSASAFSMRELLAAGASEAKSFVVPPFHHIDRLAKLPPDQATVEKYSDGAANILAVGRVVPHKGYLQLIDVFAHYFHEYNRNSRLVIVGKGGEGFSPYSKQLRRAVERAGLKSAVVFAGSVSDEVLKAWYVVADVFVTASEHEGFCVPLVEAMSMKLPIAAFASSAIPETVGDAGIVWSERNPLLLAESIDLFLRDSSVRNALGLRGLRRYESTFSNQKIEERFIAALGAMDLLA
jgi:glycosyltransferase involved in cell wall biosynthesis